MNEGFDVARSDVVKGKDFEKMEGDWEVFSDAYDSAKDELFASLVGALENAKSSLDVDMDALPSLKDVRKLLGEGLKDMDEKAMVREIKGYLFNAVKEKAVEKRK